ncbi:MAG TPA: YHS domain-containing (seleno)protein [Nitrobacter sp.]|nr:YHS domain-containing (seleno)protein [Nitrobacter sp.]
MTAQRQERNGLRRGIALIATLATVSIAAAGGIGARAATTQRVVVDRYTGLAIEGIDPVGYFTDGRPITGDPAYEAAEGGAIWRFANPDNRTFFLGHPEIYSPRFGGYDPVGVARGVTFAGTSRLWLIVGQRLYLFGDDDNRAAFAAHPARYIREADSRWPALKETLAR